MTWAWSSRTCAATTTRTSTHHACADRGARRGTTATTPRLRRIICQTAEHDEVELGPLDEPTAAEEHEEEGRRLDARDATDEAGGGRRGRRAAQARRRRGVRAANRDELSPLALLERSARAYPGPAAAMAATPVRDRQRVAARRGAAHARRRARGARRDALAQPARAARGALRRARRPWRALRDQHPPGSARGALHRRALRRACCCSTRSSTRRRARRSRPRGAGRAARIGVRGPARVCGGDSARAA